MRVLYSLIYTIAFILILPYFLVAGLFQRKYFESALQRFGFIPQRNSKPSCWIHTVSVGEFLAAKPLLRRIQDEYPDLPLFVSTTTITGQKLASQFLPNQTFYFPFDWTSCIRRVLRNIQPGVVLVFETEIWPNFLWEVHNHGIPAILINGRISDRSFQRYRLVKNWIPGFTECWMQSSEDAGRMKEIEKDGTPIQIMGNIKFDYAPHLLSSSLRQFMNRWKQSSFLLIAGSTMPGEEEELLNAFRAAQSEIPSMKLLIAPRHPERFEEVFQLALNKNFKVIRRSANQAGDETVMILDTIGELAALYELADLVFIGGTLKYGGHNPIEAAFYGKAILSGPHFENMRGIFEEFLRNDAISITQDIRSDIQRLAKDAQERMRLSDAAQNLVKSNQGAAAFVLQNLRKYLDDRHVVEQSTKSFVR